MPRAQPGQRFGGRQKGTPNKTTGLLKDAILLAAERAGGEDGMAGYLERQAKINPGPFMGLLGKVLPTQIAGDPDNPLKHEHSNATDAERVAAIVALLGKAKT